MKRVLLSIVRKKKLSIIVVCCVIWTSFNSCGNRVIITRDYIYNTDWGKGQYQGFRIAKVEFQDSNISVYNKEFSVSDLNKHVIDSIFCYGAGRNHNPKKRLRKIYFDEPNDFFIWYECRDILKNQKTIGRLKLNSWYIITGMGKATDYYVYIDNDGKSYTYSVGPKNF